MPLSKRLKDCIKAYPVLRDDYAAKVQIQLVAENECRKAKTILEEKVKEILAELDSCIPVDANKVQWERVVEIDGKLYAITHRPADMNASVPSYIREISIER